MVELSSGERQSIDLIEASLVCAGGLPGSENLDAEQYFRTAQEWTEKVRVEIERAMEEFRAHPQRYGNSENRYRAEALMSVVRDILKVDYAAAALPAGSLQVVVDSGLLVDSRHLFLTGIIGSGRKGTCVSMPFLYLALGRRLHYPLKLASAGNRLWLRWEGEEHFDLDWQNFNSPLEFRELAGERPFLNFPREIGEDRPSSVVHLFSSDDELSMLLNARGACWESHERNAEALVAYAQAHRISPACTNHIEAIAHIMPKITPFFGHTAPMAAPDYSQRRDIGMELTRNNTEWDQLEREHFAKLPPAKTIAEQNERQRQRGEFRQRRMDAQNEILLSEELRRVYGAPAEQQSQPRP